MTTYSFLTVLLGIVGFTAGLISEHPLRLLVAALASVLCLWGVLAIAPNPVAVGRWIVHLFRLDDPDRFRPRQTPTPPTTLP